MSWKTIKGHSYYYESLRVGGQHRTIYCGRGELSQLCARLDDCERIRRRHKAELWRLERDRLDAFERAEVEYFSGVERITRAALTAAGWHLHNRGEWRRKRMPRSRSTELVVSSKPHEPGRRGRTRKPGGAAPEGERRPLSHGEVCSLAERAEKGDKAALAEFREWLDHEGAYALNQFGSPQRKAEDALIERWAAGSPVHRAASTRKFDSLHKVLAGPKPSALENLLAGRVTFCWFALNCLEYQAIRAEADGGSLRMAEYVQKKLDRAHRRFLSAVKSLAVVRRLAMPGTPLVAIQQNVMAALDAADPTPPALDVTPETRTAGSTRTRR